VLVVGGSGGMTGAPRLVSEAAMRAGDREIAIVELDAALAVFRELGATRSVLETGIYQDEAIGLYRRAGYTEVDCWGEYARSPTSVCFEKSL